MKTTEAINNRIIRASYSIQRHDARARHNSCCPNFGKPLNLPSEDKAILLKNASIIFAHEIENELTLPKAFVRKMV
jgi:hypothetical protein